MQSLTELVDFLTPGKSLVEPLNEAIICYPAPVTKEPFQFTYATVAVILILNMVLNHFLWLALFFVFGSMKNHYLLFRNRQAQASKLLVSTTNLETFQCLKH